MALLRALLCAAGLLGTAHSILHELNPTNPEHHEQIKTLLEDCQLQMIFVSPPANSRTAPTDQLWSCYHLHSQPDPVGRRCRRTCTPSTTTRAGAS